MPTIDLQATGMNIRKKMDDKGITVRKLQDIFGFQTPVALYKWLRGQEPAIHRQHGNSGAGVRYYN